MPLWSYHGQADQRIISSVTRRPPCTNAAAIGAVLETARDDLGQHPDPVLKVSSEGVAGSRKFDSQPIGHGEVRSRIDVGIDGQAVIVSPFLSAGVGFAGSMRARYPAQDVQHGIASVPENVDVCLGKSLFIVQSRVSIPKRRS